MSDETPMDAAPHSVHRRAWDLIPWVVNGSASDEARRLVEQHAQGCADCREEFDFQCRLRDGMAAPAAASTLDADHALGRFWGRVDAEQTGTAWDSLAAQPPAADNARRGRWQSALIAAVVVQALGLATLLGVLWERPHGAQHGAEYQVLSQPPVTVAGIRLVPAPGLSLGELRALLERHELQLLQANADATHFALGLRPGAGLSVAEAVQRLRAEPGVLLAEPLTPPRP